ncbi:ORF6N domain-containing protein [Pseudomonas cichorii]|nr:ORF6N domain-containing protein [Pseudomonas cichorii]
MIDQVHERPEGTARRNFNEHRKRFVDGHHCFEVTADEIRTQSISVAFSPRTAKGVLLTERGYLLLSKALNDDLAWTVQRQLVNRYFRHAAAPALPGDYISALEHLQAWCSSPLPHDRVVVSTRYPRIWPVTGLVTTELLALVRRVRAGGARQG